MNSVEKDYSRLELAAAQDEFEDLFGAIRSILISVDASGFVRRWSDVSAKTFGLSHEDVLGRPFAQLPICWDWLAVNRAADLCRQTGLPTRVDDLDLNADQLEARLLGLTITPCRRGGFLVLGADVTFKKLEERVLMDRERFYRSIVDNIQDVIFETDAAGHWTFLNPAFERFVGGTVNEATGRPALDCATPQDRRKALVWLVPILRGVAPATRFEIRYIRPDGTEAWAEVHVEAQRGDNGEFLGTFGTIREVSERHRNEELEKQLAQQMLRQTEDRVKTIIEEAPLLVFSLDRDGLVTFCDGKTLDKLGMTPNQLEGISSFDALPDQPEAWAAIREALSGKPARVAIQLTDVHLDVRYSPIFDENGRPNGATGVAIDVTESHKLETQLVHARKMESIGHLAAGLAHEVNTPAQYIADNTRFVRDSFDPIQELLLGARAVIDGVGGPAAEAFERRWQQQDMDYLIEEIPAALKQSLEGLSRVTQIVKSMKQFSHPGTRDFQWANLNEQIESTLTVSRNEWKYVAAVEKLFDKDLPEVWCSAAELNQVFLNMIVNASHAIADYVEAGKYDQGVISISTRRLGDGIEIEIRDNAGGIPAHIREKIFDPFFTTKDPGKGTGQGLALAQSVIVEMHKGQIALDSEEGVGTAFSIRIPIGKPNEMPIMDKEAA